MKVTFRWETTREEGATDGAIYFDDASLQLIPGSESLVPVDPSELKSTVEDEDAAEETMPEEKPADAKPADAPEKK
jgi:hypothetical protein